MRNWGPAFPSFGALLLCAAAACLATRLFPRFAMRRDSSVHHLAADYDHVRRSLQIAGCVRPMFLSIEGFCDGHRALGHVLTGSAVAGTSKICRHKKKPPARV